MSHHDDAFGDDRFNLRDVTDATFQFHRLRAGLDKGTRTRDGLRGVIVSMDGKIGDEEGPSATPEDFSPPGGAFVVGWDGDRPVAGGGIKRLGDSAAEIKRMYVAPEARGAGLGRP